MLITKTTHVFAKGGGNFELFWWKKERVVQRGRKFVSLVNKHIKICMYLPEEMAILNCSGGKRNLFFRGVAIMFC